MDEAVAHPRSDSASPTRQATEKYVPALDGLRAIAIGSVFLLHLDDVRESSFETLEDHSATQQGYHRHRDRRDDLPGRRGR